MEMWFAIFFPLRITHLSQANFKEDEVIKLFSKLSKNYTICDSLSIVPILFGVVEISGDVSALQRRGTEINCFSELEEAIVSTESYYQISIFIRCGRINHKVERSIGRDY